MATEDGLATVSHLGTSTEDGLATVSHLDSPGIAEKGWWGPRIWRILHSLAEINDRNDVGPAWRQVLHLTSEILPCAVCRAHFRGHVRGLSFPIGVSNYAALRRFLWAVHAGTRPPRATAPAGAAGSYDGSDAGTRPPRATAPAGAAGSYDGSDTPFLEDQLAAEYGGTREEIVIRVTGLVAEVVTAFRGGRVLDALHVVSLNPWHRAMAQLIAMLRYPQPPAAPRRRGGGRR